MPRVYATAKAFRTALEGRLNKTAGAEKIQVNRVRGQFAEKLHAYTLPRSSTNSRVKDLIDMALLIRSKQLTREGAADALRLTFVRRQTHELPSVLLKPPSEWQGRFSSLAEECQLPANMGALFAEVEAFFGQLAGSKGRT